MSKRKMIARLCLAAAAVILCLALRPWYRDYIRDDHTETCRKARFWLALRYEDELKAPAAGDDGTDAGDSAGRSGESGAGGDAGRGAEPGLDGERLRALLTEKLAEQFDAELLEGEGSEALYCDGLCREGGRWAFHLIEETGQLEIDCSCGWHDPVVRPKHPVAAAGN